MIIHERIEIEPKTVELVLARSFVRECLETLDIAPSIVSLIILATDEALSNIICHGLTDPNTPSTLQVEVRATLDKIQIYIHDRGIPFDSSDFQSHDLSEHIREGRRSGLGLHLIHLACDDIEYQSSPETGNTLCLTKRLLESISPLSA
ncbi:MAG: ATP-binding protein [Planctomycetota bacterium]|jgi:anti-sigma regulatory factor (Ser/Thr protein kinase)|nr:ATP-binding protein [Planctomycetota bacterium]